MTTGRLISEEEADKLKSKQKEAQKNNEAKEEIFKNLAVRIQTIAEARAIPEDKTKKVPAAEAAPFPPLNLSQTGNTCPTRQQKLEIKTSFKEQNKPVR